MLPVLVSAQNKQIVEAKYGEDLSIKVSNQMQYLFPEFTNGDVYYNGYNGKGRLNYNMLLGEMQFIENDQIMTLTNTKNVIVLNIDNRKFYPFNDKEFTEELLSTGKHQLRVRRKATASPHSKKGAYGTESSISSSSNVSYSTLHSGMYNLDVEEKLVISLNYYYYLVGKNGKYALIKNIKPFTKQFPAFRAQIKEFVNENRTRFNNEDDLKALLEFCSKLGD